MTDRYVVFDVETPNAANNRMSAIGVAVIENGEIVRSLSTLVNPECSFDAFNVRLTGITPAMAEKAPTFPQVWRELEPLFGDAILVAHNAPFDMAVLSKCLLAYGIRWKPIARYVCTVRMGKQCYPALADHRLDTLCRHLRIPLDHHQAGSDSQACARLLLDYLRQGADKTAFLRRYDMEACRTLRK